MFVKTDLRFILWLIAAWALYAAWERQTKRKKLAKSGLVTMASYLNDLREK